MKAMQRLLKHELLELKVHVETKNLMKKSVEEAGFSQKFKSIYDYRVPKSQNIDLIFF